MRTFFGDADYEAYLSLLTEWCEHYGVAIWAYCLMPNHVHLIMVPGGEDGLARAIGETHRRYTRRVNFREGWRGHLWQDRFASFVMDEPYLLSATRYVEMNPVRAKLVERPQDWPWSSAKAHLSGASDGLAETDWLTEMTAGWACTWGEFLLQPGEDDLGRKLRLHERTGRPLGDQPFLQRLEKLLARPLMPSKPGRPRKKKGK